MSASNLALRAKGRHKLQELIAEALEVCRKYDHAEYACDFHSIRFDLAGDARVEAKQAGEAP